AGELARATAGAAADSARDVRLDRWFGKWEEVRAEADPAVVAEQNTRNMEKRALEIRERDPAIDGEPFELMEDGVVRGVDVVTAIDPSDRHHVDGRLVFFQLVDLRRRRLGAQQRVLVQKERVARRARRMRRRECELVEVVLDSLDLAVVADLVAEPEERVLDDPANLR